MMITRCPVGELPSSTAVWVNRSSLFGSGPFMRLWETLGGQPVYWMASENDRAVAILPGIEFGSGFLTRFQAMPDGLYAPLLHPQGTPDDASVLSAKILAGLVQYGYAKLYLNDYFGQFADPARLAIRKGATLVVDIRSVDWEPPDKKLRSEIRKAEREGVRVEVFSLNRHYDQFLALMCYTEKRHGRKPKYPDGFYRELGKLSMTDSRVKWLVCEHEGKLAASHIYLTESNVVLNWQVFFDKQFSFLKANQLITFTVGREIARQGLSMLNLGATPADASTLDDYKRKWGGYRYEYNCLEHKKWWSRWL
ncbi:MAG: GNAT family N-acetyltransferase [candidate division Zixibacteria bacterium]|nr:GNAT family N-acetyltransferase [candidate division Zixibacteria bacterium]